MGQPVCGAATLSEEEAAWQMLKRVGRLGGCRPAAFRSFPVSGGVNMVRVRERVERCKASRRRRQRIVVTGQAARRNHKRRGRPGHRAQEARCNTHLCKSALPRRAGRRLRRVKRILKRQGGQRRASSYQMRQLWKTSALHANSALSTGDDVSFAGERRSRTISSAQTRLPVRRQTLSKIPTYSLQVRYRGGTLWK